MTMTTAKINALIASAYNIHVGPIERGEAMTPTKAAALHSDERAKLCEILREKGGSSLYTQEQANEAYLAIIGGRA